MSALWAVLPAGGSGSRFGAPAPKQFLEIEGRSLLGWSVAALLDAAPLAGVIVALPAGVLESLDRSAPLDDPRVGYCVGGASRAESVAAGIAALDADPGDWLLVHDAARPCVPAGDVRRLVEAVMADGVGGILATPVTDTLKRADANGRVEATVDRARFWRALTPQMFRVGELRAALEDARAAGAAITDEASAMERAGHPVRLIEGSASNIKVTFPEDLPLAGFHLRQQKRVA